MANFNYLLNNCGGGVGPWNTNGGNIYYNAGNIGIGTTAPQAALHVASSSYAALRLDSGTGLASIITAYNGPAAGGGLVLFPASDARLFSVVGSDIANATSSLTVLRDGNVGIGTTSPAVSLDVRTGGMPQIGVAGATSYLTMFTSDVWGSTLYWNPNQDMRFGKGGNGLYNSAGYVELMRIQSSTGNVGIGTQSPNAKLDVAGTVNASGGVTQNSDLRLKTAIAPLASGTLDIILQLRPVTFRWKEPKDATMHGTQTGLVAQEVEKILPTVVTTGPGAVKTKGIKYNELTVILIKAVQEQQKQIAYQARELRNVQLANKRLEARLANVERIHLARK